MTHEYASVLPSVPDRVFFHYEYQGELVFEGNAAFVENEARTPDLTSLGRGGAIYNTRIGIIKFNAELTANGNEAFVSTVIDIDGADSPGCARYITPRTEYHRVDQVFQIPQRTHRNRHPRCIWELRPRLLFDTGGCIFKSRVALVFFATLPPRSISCFLPSFLFFAVSLLLHHP